MGHGIVKILVDDSGEIRHLDDQVWHLSVYEAGCNMTFCEGELYGPASAATEFEFKDVKRGITCPKCIERIKDIKSIQL